MKKKTFLLQRAEDKLCSAFQCSDGTLLKLLGNKNSVKGRGERRKGDKKYRLSCQERWGGVRNKGTKKNGH